MVIYYKNYGHSLESDDPNVREALLQLLIFIEGGEKKIEEEDLIQTIAKKLNDDKDFVVNKAIQALIAIGRKSPSLVTKIISEQVKECPDDETVKNAGDNILKAIVSIEKVEEIVEEEW